jgi:hypothetical protein
MEAKYKTVKIGNISMLSRGFVLGDAMEEFPHTIKFELSVKHILIKRDKTLNS